MTPPLFKGRPQTRSPGRAGVRRPHWVGCEGPLALRRCQGRGRRGLGPRGGEGGADLVANRVLGPRCPGMKARQLLSLSALNGTQRLVRPGLSPPWAGHTPGEGLSPAGLPPLVSAGHGAPLWGLTPPPPYRVTPQGPPAGARGSSTPGRCLCEVGTPRDCPGQEPARPRKTAHAQGGRRQPPAWCLSFPCTH